MTTRERMLALRLLEKQEKNPDFIRKLGVQVKVEKKDDKSALPLRWLGELPR